MKPSAVTPARWLNPGRRGTRGGTARGWGGAVILPLMVVGAVAGATSALRAGSPGSAAAWQYFRARSVETLGALARVPTQAPTLEAGVEELAITELFGAIGDGGLEYTERARTLAGKRVRLSGFMVREEKRQRGVFLLVARSAPPQLDTSCVAADLPPAVVYVHLPPEREGRRVPYEPGRLVLDGILQLGPQREADGRNSFVRLRLEPGTPSASGHVAIAPVVASP